MRRREFRIKYRNYRIKRRIFITVWCLVAFFLGILVGIFGYEVILEKFSELTANFSPMNLQYMLILQLFLPYIPLIFSLTLVVFILLRKWRFTAFFGGILIGVIGWDIEKGSYLLLGGGVLAISSVIFFVLQFVIILLLVRAILR